MKREVSENAVAQNTPRIKKHPRLRAQDNRALQTFCYIYIGFMVLFSLIPLYITIINSLKSNSAVATNIYTFPQFAQLGKNMASNFSRAWNIVYRHMFNSILVSFVAAVVNAFVASVLAYIFVRKRFYFKEFIFKIYIIILLVPSILGMSTLYPMMADTFNLKNSYFALWLPVVAGGQAGALFLFRTFFASQPSAIYESAMLDGANDAQVYFYFTLPLALPIILLSFVGTFGGQYNDCLVYPSDAADE